MPLHIFTRFCILTVRIHIKHALIVNQDHKNQLNSKRAIIQLSIFPWIIVFIYCSTVYQSTYRWCYARWGDRRRSWSSHSRQPGWRDPAGCDCRDPAGRGRRDPAGRGRHNPGLSGYATDTPLPEYSSKCVELILDCRGCIHKHLVNAYEPLKEQWHEIFNTFFLETSPGPHMNRQKWFCEFFCVRVVNDYGMLTPCQLSQLLCRHDGSVVKLRGNDVGWRSHWPHENGVGLVSDHTNMVLV